MDKVTCEICFFEDYSDKFVIFSACSHYFCKNDVKSLIETAINTGDLKSLVCPNADCRIQIAEIDMKDLVNEETLIKYHQFSLN